MVESVAGEFVELFVRHQRAVYGYILTISPNIQDVDEVFQETSLVLWKKRDEFNTGLPFFPWACGVARQVARNHRAKKARDRHWFSEELQERISEARAEHSDWLDAALKSLADCLGKLTDDERHLLHLRYDGPCSVEQIAQGMNRPANSIYQRLHRIRRRLYDCVNSRLRKELR